MEGEKRGSLEKQKIYLSINYESGPRVQQPLMEHAMVQIKSIHHHPQAVPTWPTCDVRDTDVLSNSQAIRCEGTGDTQAGLA